MASSGAPAYRDARALPGADGRRGIGRGVPSDPVIGDGDEVIIEAVPVRR